MSLCLLDPLSKERASAHSLPPGIAISLSSLQVSVVRTTVVESYKPEFDLIDTMPYQMNVMV